MIAMIGLPGGSEMVIIVVAFLFLIFGAKKLPEMARSIGSSVVEFKRGFREVKEPIDETKKQVNSAVKDIKDTAKKAMSD